MDDAWRVIVTGGKAVVEGLDAYADGTEIILGILDEYDLEDRRLLHESLERSREQVERGDRRYTLAEILGEIDAEPGDDPRPGYDFSGGERGKYVSRYAEGTNVVLLDPEVAERFPTSEAVNAALRELLRAKEGR